MSAENLKAQIRTIREKMTKPRTYNYMGDLTGEFFKDINLLQQRYGEFLGNAKAKHQEYLQELSRLDNDITTCFVKLTQVSQTGTIFQILNLAIGRISELMSFVETIESKPPDEQVSKASYDKLLREKEKAENIAEFLVQNKGLPELHRLMEHAKSVGIEIDEYWVLALCSSNLIEAIVNKKLEQLGEKTDGNFEERYKKLCRVIKEKEGKDIHQILPSAVYKVRSKLDHATHENRVTSKEAENISKVVIEFMNEVFQ
jgi:hypothetical protein